MSEKPKRKLPKRLSERDTEKDGHVSEEKPVTAPVVEDDDPNDNGELLPEDPKLGDVIGDAWAARVFIFIGAFLGLLCAVGFLSLVTPRHTAKMIIGPAERSGGTDIKALFPENSSFALKYLVDSIGSGDSTDFMRFEYILLEVSVAKQLMEDPYIVRGVKKGKRFLFMSGPTVRNAVELSAYLKDNVAIEPVAATPMRRLVYLHPDPLFAVNLLVKIYQAADDIIKTDIKDKALKRHSYFSKALENEKNPEHREALTSLIMEQEHVLRMLALDEPFAATVVEEATTGQKPDWPPYPLVITVFMFAGIFWNYARYHKRYKGRDKSKKYKNFDA